MNYLKTALLTLALVSASLMAMDQEAPHRANPCTKLKAAFVLGLAFFAGSAMHDYQTTPQDPSTLGIMAGRDVKTTIIDSDSGLIIPDLNAAIEAYKAKHGLAECDTVPYIANSRDLTQTLKLKCRTLPKEEYHGIEDSDYRA